MNRLLRADLEALIEEREGPCVSLYFPIFHAAARTQQGPIRLRNLLRRAEAELLAQGVTAAAIAQLLAPLEIFLDDVLFWDAQEEGTALFAAPAFSQAFRLPAAFTERCMIGPRFFIKPLLPLVSAADVFYVLALSQNEVRLLEATCRSVRRLLLPELPSSIAAALGEQKAEQYLQYHTAASTSAGAMPAVYHGHRVGVDAVKDELRRYLRQIDTVVRTHLAGGSAPLVLAAADPLPALYREVSRYPHLAAAAVAGNPEHVRDAELRHRAWALIEPALLADRRRLAARYGELAGTGHASDDVREVLPAARSGRIEALFLAEGTDLWGRLDESTGAVQVHAAREPGDDELLDAAAHDSLRNGGTVYAGDRCDVPGGGPLAAVFRY